MSSTTPLHGCFVTGTDTEIGKTRVSAALLHWFAQSDLRSAGFKPVSAGTDVIDGLRVNGDVRALREAGSLALTDAEVGPLQFEAACAPHIAAALEGRAIDRATILSAVRALAARADMLVVEGVGGFCVPLGADWDTADLAVELGLPVVLVVGLRLGCISHALLTAEAIRARGLRLAGWVGNRVVRDMPWADENVATLREWLWQRHDAPCLGVVPWLANPHPAAVAAHLDAATVQAVFASSPAAFST
ncbi:dethiobiotin synthase [Ramlibacter sp.]|uniref:dethiobiotin synthase n=1 Tax=Ramlibacter sp. TaxID=1917967 RepID=UPI002FCCAFB1